MVFDDYGQTYVNSDTLCDLLYRDPTLDLRNFLVADPEQFNDSIASLFADEHILQKYNQPDLTVEEFDRQNQAQWYMPAEYLNLDIVEYILSLCSSEAEYERVAIELALYDDRDMFNLLRYLKYLVDTMRAHNIVWGVGRGSSTASYILFLLGVHKIDSIRYNLPIEEFLK